MTDPQDLTISPMKVVVSEAPPHFLDPDGVGESASGSIALNVERYVALLSHGRRENRYDTCPQL